MSPKKKKQKDKIKLFLLNKIVKNKSDKPIFCILKNGDHVKLNSPGKKKSFSFEKNIINFYGLYTFAIISKIAKTSS